MEWSGCKIPHINEHIIHVITLKTLKVSHFQIDPQKFEQAELNKSSGLVIVYYKSNLEPYINVIERGDQYGWLKISKSLFYNLNSDIYSFLYNASTSSRYYDENFFDNININTLNYFDEESRVIFIGDFNGSVSNLVDHVQLDYT